MTFYNFVSPSHALVRFVTQSRYEDKRIVAEYVTANRPEAGVVVPLVAESQDGVVEEHPLFTGEVLPLETGHFVHDLLHLPKHFVSLDVSHRRLFQPFADHTNLIVIHLQTYSLAVTGVVYSNKVS